MRLGELVVNTRGPDCSGSECLEEPQDFTVTRTHLIPHPGFVRIDQNIINDIGLIRLPMPAEFNREWVDNIPNDKGVRGGKTNLMYNRGLRKYLSLQQGRDPCLSPRPWGQPHRGEGNNSGLGLHQHQEASLQDPRGGPGQERGVSSARDSPAEGGDHGAGQ